MVNLALSPARPREALDRERQEAVKQTDPGSLPDRPMAYSQSLRLLIRARLESGVLPRSALQRVSGGPGNGESCIACSEIIVESQFAMEGTGERRTVFQFHVDCFSLWDVERNAS